MNPHPPVCFSIFFLFLFARFGFARDHALSVHLPGLSAHMCNRTRSETSHWSLPWQGLLVFGGNNLWSSTSLPVVVSVRAPAAPQFPNRKPESRCVRTTASFCGKHGCLCLQREESTCWLLIESGTGVRCYLPSASLLLHPSPCTTTSIATPPTRTMPTYHFHPTTTT